MSRNWLCRINRHKYALRHNTEDEKLSYLECVRCKKQRHWGLNLQESMYAYLERPELTHGFGPKHDSGLT